VGRDSREGEAHREDLLLARVSSDEAHGLELGKVLAAASNAGAAS
jgi:hypothetical protein